MAKPSKKRLNISLTQKRFIFNKLNISDIEQLDVTVLKSLKEQLKSLTDSRQKAKKVYKIWDVVICTILAVFYGCDSWDDIHDFILFKYNWLKSFLKLSGGVPSVQTIERIFSIIDPKQLEDSFTFFFQHAIHFSSTTGDIISIDGKVDCGSSRNQTNLFPNIKPLNVLNAYSNKYGICLASEMIDDKTNEIPSIPTILKRLNIKDSIITWDALNTQKDNVSSVIDGLGNYVVPIKGNHPVFLEELQLYFDDTKLQTIIAGNSMSSYKLINEKSHACFITYEYFQTYDIDWFQNKNDWKHLNTIGLVKKTITKNHQVSVEKRFYISSLDLDIDLFSKAIRNHWSVENNLHWHLDFTFRQDKNTTMNKYALMNLQLVNKLCLGILNKAKPFYDNISIRRIRKILSYDFEQQIINIFCYLNLS